MKINLTHIDKIQRALDAVNGRATAHTITQPLDIQALASRAEKSLCKMGLPKKMWPRVRVTFSPSGPGKAYMRRGRFIATTRVVIERGASGWFLTSCERRETWADAKEEYSIRVSAAAVSVMTKSVFADFIAEGFEP